MENNSPWYKSWFNSPYYHILYKKRDYTEAEFLLDNLITKLKIKSQHHILDLACGRGRFVHSLFERGFCARGLDLSKKNIEIAIKKNNIHPSSFIQQDMRVPFGINIYDFVLNLFTSFGYFNSQAENIKIIANVADSLKQNGKFVFDYFNVNQTLSQLVSQEVIVSDGIKFVIKRERKNNRILKHIIFNDKGKDHHYKEDVELIDKNHIETYLKRNKMRTISYYGDYHLNPFDPYTSKRMIVLSEKY